MGVPNNQWSSSGELNLTYELCSTYPSQLYVPSTATSQMLQASAAFRSRGRLPVLSYLHTNSATICRCAQPLTGLNARSTEDEQLMECILKTNPNSKFMYVVDTRPKINAMANKAQGKGYENENNYANIQFYFIGIENIHVMRDSLQKLIQCSEISGLFSNNFFPGLEKSDWLKHVKAVIDTSVFIAEAVSLQNVSVVVHCSDGWDRTAQTCALASLLLDPYYRTIHGFQILIEKEWLMFGHKFSHRLGHIYESESMLKEMSPIFTQFLECVWQISQQFPCAFEFNEKFLIKLHEHAYSCQFGTFIGNCHKDRVDLRVSETTYSLWDYIQYRLDDFLNPIYVPNSVYSKQVIRPDTRPHNFRFWRGLYNRFDPMVNDSENLTDTLNLIKNRTTILNEYAKLLEKKFSDLKTATAEASDTDKTYETTTTTTTMTDIDDISIRLEEMLKLDSSGLGSLRSSCGCFDANDYASSKLNCSKCGKVFCNSCVEENRSLLVNDSLKFICKICLSAGQLN